MPSKNESREQKADESRCQQGCPVAFLVSMIGDCFDRESEAHKHFTQSRVELLKGVRALVDKRIGALEESMKPRKPAKATKITVE